MKKINLCHFHMARPLTINYRNKRLLVSGYKQMVKFKYIPFKARSQRGRKRNQTTSSSDMNTDQAEDSSNSEHYDQRTEDKKSKRRKIQTTSK